MTYILMVNTGTEQRVVTPSLYLTPVTHPGTNGPIQSLLCYDKSDIKQGVMFLNKKYPNTPILIAKVKFQGTPVGEPFILYQEFSEDGDILPVSKENVEF